ncbi:hypothetical protein, partial [Massilia frigida]|uniref:hypothetical protein n=1 Tax=Massilia frigida TaxID=2609281 RepID=UPI001CB74788
YEIDHDSATLNQQSPSNFEKRDQKSRFPHADRFRKIVLQLAPQYDLVGDTKWSAVSNRANCKTIFLNWPASRERDFPSHFRDAGRILVGYGGGIMVNLI